MSDSTSLLILGEIKALRDDMREDVSGIHRKLDSHQDKNNAKFELLNVAAAKERIKVKYLIRAMGTLAATVISVTIVWVRKTFF